MTFHVPIARLDSRGSARRGLCSWPSPGIPCTQTPQRLLWVVGLQEDGSVSLFLAVPGRAHGLKSSHQIPALRHPPIPGSGNCSLELELIRVIRIQLRKLNGKQWTWFWNWEKWTSIAYTYMTQDGKPSKDQESQLCTNKQAMDLI